MSRQLRLPHTSALRGVLFSFLCFLFMAANSAVLAGGASPDSYPVGLRTFGVWEPGTQERFDLSVWYPSRISSSESVQEGWVVEAGKRGRIVAGAFPVILLSHDTAGGRFAHNDLAAALAAGGMIVIAPTHSGDNQNSASGIYSVELLRDRPRHLLHALETVLSSQDFAPYVDEARIGLVGIGVGAISVMQIGGARPDFSRLEDYCGTESLPDAFCSRWVKDKLAQLPTAMAALEKEQGDTVFSPPLALYTPALVPVAVPQELDKKEIPHERLERKRGFWQRLFGEEPEDGVVQESREESSPAETNAGAGGAPEAAAEHVTIEKGTASAAGSPPEGSPLTAGSGTDEDQNPQQEESGAETAGKEHAAPVAPYKADANVVYRRKPDIRRIRGIALVAPAGGMLFSRESLAGIHAPVAILEAGQDSLYPPQRHARSYFASLPVQPLVLQLSGADHFSLYARCSKDTLATLRQTCGRLTGDARSAVIRERNLFLVSFFQSAMGGMTPVLRPSGFAAALSREEQGNL